MGLEESPEYQDPKHLRLYTSIPQIVEIVHTNEVFRLFMTLCMHKYLMYDCSHAIAHKNVGVQLCMQEGL